MTFRTYQSNVIAEITEVRFYDDTVAKVKDGHPEVPIELPSVMDAVGNAVGNPTRIEASHAGSYLFIDEDTTNKAGEPLFVPVKVVEGTSARVRSVYFSGNDPGRTVLWRRS